jgi:uncharacterized protein YndB with AHSA1/START domain
MTSIESTVDTDQLTLTFVSEFDASPERVWQVWEDPRQLERWWGPPTWPATFERHDFVAGGESHYYMTGPEGEKAGGLWRFTAIDATHSFEIVDGFATPDGTLDESMPTSTMRVTLDDLGANGTAKTRMTNVTTLGSLDELEKLLAMGMREGMTLAMGQIEALLLE